MVDVEALGQIFSIEVAAWAIAALNGVLAWRLWPVIPNIMGKLNEKRRDKQNGVNRHQDRLEARNIHLEERGDALAQERDEWRARAIAAEAERLGSGRAQQEAQRIVSADREARKGKPSE